MRGGGELLGDGLFELITLRSHENDLAIIAAQFFDGCKDWVWLEQHALAAAAKVVVGLAVFVGGPVAQIVGVHFDEVLFTSAFDDAFAEWSECYFWEKCENIDAHGERMKFQVGSFKR